MNKLETAFSQYLDLLKLAGKIVEWKFNMIRLGLGGGAWYKPDFMVVWKDGYVTMYETKGHWREAARVRIKVAAGIHTWCEFVAVTRPKKDWVFEAIG